MRIDADINKIVLIVTSFACEHNPDDAIIRRRIEMPSVRPVNADRRITRRRPERLTHQNGMLFAKRYHLLEKIKQVSVPVQVVPVKPTDFVVLAVRIIVAVLRIAELIARKNHRYAQASQKDCRRILNHLVPFKADAFR